MKILTLGFAKSNMYLKFLSITNKRKEIEIDYITPKTQN